MINTLFLTDLVFVSLYFLFGIDHLGLFFVTISYLDYSNYFNCLVEYSEAWF
jgi:hypothetical protein